MCDCQFVITSTDSHSIDVNKEVFFIFFLFFKSKSCLFFETIQLMTTRVNSTTGGVFMKNFTNSYNFIAQFEHETRE